MVDILIKNATIVTVNPKREILYNAALAISGSRIVDIGDTDALCEKYPQAKRVIDGEGKAVFPGMINTHNHLFQTNLKGMGDDKDLKDWLKDMMFPSATHLVADDCYTGAMIGSMEGLHSGVTTQVDYMHAHPVAGLSDAVIQAFKDLKIRAVFARGHMDCGEQFGVQRGLMQSVETIEADIRRLMEQYDGAEDGRIHIWMAPSAPWSSSPAAMQMTKRLYDEGVRLTVHTSETPFDRDSTMELHGFYDTDLLAHYGLLGPCTLLVHCVHLTDRDIRMVKATDTKISHNPASNMYLSSGVARVADWNLAGIDAGLGTDGAASNNANDMLELLKLTALLQKVSHLDPTIITAEKVLEMATIDGARCIGQEDEIGSLEIGKKADLFIFNPERNIKAIPMHHPVSTLVYSSSTENVETVIVDGQIVLEDGKVQTVDEPQMIKRCRQQADALSERAGTWGLKKRPWRNLAY